MQKVWCEHDKVAGKLIRWESVEDAAWFLYHYRTEGLLTLGPHGHGVPLPPRFVDSLGDFKYSDTPCINLDTSLLPSPPKDNVDTAETLGNFNRFDAKMHQLSRDHWVNSPKAWRSGPCGTESYPLQSHDRASSPIGPNGVSATRIRSGADIRTTVMVRNLPNLVTFSEVKSLCDKFCSGRYDFLYLRADFKTGNNVGYFFVNFNNAETLLEFKLAVEDYPMIGWEHCAKRTKLAYADCQGVDSLIDRFRNSAIMQEPYDRRPHVSRVACQLRLILLMQTSCTTPLTTSIRLLVSMLLAKRNHFLLLTTSLVLIALSPVHKLKGSLRVA